MNLEKVNIVGLYCIIILKCSVQKKNRNQLVAQEGFCAME